MTAGIALPCGRVAIVDAEDFDRASTLRWRAAPPGARSKRRYVYAYAGGRKVYLHRFILDAPAGFQVDHKSLDTLDNRRGNLRLATQSLNNANRPTKNASGFRGVHKTRNGTFRAIISDRSRGSKNAGLGTFLTAEEAARAYDREAIRRFGSFARLNFPAIPQALREAA